MIVLLALYLENTGRPYSVYCYVFMRIRFMLSVACVISQVGVDFRIHVCKLAPYKFYGHVHTCG